MECDLTKIKQEDMGWYNLKFKKEEYTFVEIYGVLYVFLGPIEPVLVEQITCSFCKEKTLSKWLIAREGMAYRLQYCTNCKLGSLVESEKDIKSIPARILEIIKYDFKLEEEQ